MENRFGVGALVDTLGARSVVIMNPPEPSQLAGLIRLTPDEARDLGRELLRYSSGPTDADALCSGCRRILWGVA